MGTTTGITDKRGSGNVRDSEKELPISTVRWVPPIKGVPGPEIFGLLRLGRTRLVASGELRRLIVGSGELRPLGAFELSRVAEYDTGVVALGAP
jgi:hypothetical protein